MDPVLSRINDLLLQTIGAADMSLGEEAFAEAVMEWQRKNGFSADEVDGIIGPITWKKMKIKIGATN